MTRDPSAVAADLIAALRSGRSNATLGGELKARVQSRLAVSLMSLTPAGASPTPAPNAAPVTSSGSLTAAHGAGISKGALIAWLAAVFATGVLTGVGLDRWQLKDSASHARPAVTRSAPAVAVNPQPEPVNAPVMLPEQLEMVSLPNAPVMPTASTGGGTSPLAAERHLLDEARQALARGEPQAGLTPLGLHAKRFPRGVLTEEREALAVRLLAALGNQTAATERAQRFHQRFPKSLFTPAVDNAVAPFSKRNADDESKP